MLVDSIVQLVEVPRAGDCAIQSFDNALKPVHRCAGGVHLDPGFLERDLLNPLMLGDCRLEALRTQY